MIAMKIVKWITARKTIQFADLVKDAKSMEFFFLPSAKTESGGMT